MLEYERASFSYGAQSAVESVSFSLSSGRFLLLAGESGSGKSTLVRMANGLIPHFHRGGFHGRVLVGGTDTRSCSVRQLAREVGVVFQNQKAQLFSSTVEAELAFGPRNLGLPREEILRRMAWAAGGTGVAHLLGRPTGDLSGGEAARVAIACVLAMGPRILLLDEPFSALDPTSALSVRELLGNLRAKGIIIVVAEHRTDGLWELSDAVAVMHRGRLALHAPPSEAAREPTAGFPVPLPAMARLFSESRLPDRPFTVEQAVDLVRSGNLTLLPRSAQPASPGEAVLAAEAVTCFRGPRQVLRDVSLELRCGETVALVGPNGAGKSTLLRTIAGLARLNGGRVTGGNSLPIPRGELGVLFQNAGDNLLFRSVREEVEYSAKILGRHQPAWVETLFDCFDLRSLLDRHPLSLSEGEQRRVALAAALAHRPSVLLLDEPTVGQDTYRREELAKTLEMVRSQGVATLVATHDLEFAAEHCSRWLVLSSGELLANARPGEVMGSPGLMARANLLPTPIARLAAGVGVAYPGERAVLVPALVGERVGR